ncbi:alpha/beta hydrolase [Glycomyces buryatensis]|uniref:Alpha/beta hydrolase n=1 Tax=Glycomyces buryatensis TaxID=2570927 RepID=A0A4S8PZD7_9ACTN|nr:alpha/beta hydrolase [Glycomyces buryatensis]THV37068.1 alpha/beta hydrolase [Glycomyces buryatensis]
MDDCLIALVHSPLTGPSAWEPVAASLRERGFRVVVPAFGEVFASAGPYYQAAADAIGGRIPPGIPVVLVAHSGAGALLPSIETAVPGTIGAVFVDALLPHPGRSWFDTVPPEFRDQLHAVAEHGRLPRWSDWFPPETIAELLPDPGQRERFISELPRLPLSYFEEAAPDPPRWPAGWCGYLQLSEAYDVEAAEAARSGWSVDRLDGDHLSIATRPGDLAECLARIVFDQE